MTLTEANTIQEYILKILQKDNHNLKWEYLSPETIQRNETNILLRETLVQKLIELNQEIKEQQTCVASVESSGSPMNN